MFLVDSQKTESEQAWQKFSFEISTEDCTKCGALKTNDAKNALDRNWEDFFYKQGALFAIYKAVFWSLITIIICLFLRRVQIDQNRIVRLGIFIFMFIWTICWTVLMLTNTWSAFTNNCDNNSSACIRVVFLIFIKFILFITIIWIIMQYFFGMIIIAGWMLKKGEIYMVEDMSLCIISVPRTGLDSVLDKISDLCELCMVLKNIPYLKYISLGGYVDQLLAWIVTKIDIA